MLLGLTHVFLFDRNVMLNISSGIEDMGIMRWQLVLSLVAAWLIVFLCLSKGVQSSGKVSTHNIFTFTCYFLIAQVTNLLYFLTIDNL